MKRLLVLAAALICLVCPAKAQQAAVVSVCGIAALDAGVPHGLTQDVNGRLCINVPAYPQGATPITISATGTTAATTATLAAAVGKTTYMCGFSIRANATAAANGNATVSGTITGTLNFTQWTAPVASGIGLVEPPIDPYCIPASAVNTAIVVTSAAPGSGGVVSVTAWGFQL